MDSDDEGSGGFLREWMGCDREESEDEETSTGDAAGGSSGDERADEDVGSETAEEEGEPRSTDLDVGGGENVEGEVEGSSPTTAVTAGIPTAAELIASEYDNWEEAYGRYVAYARGIGFAVRKGDSIKDEQGRVVRKFIYCNKQGLRDRKHYERADRKRPHKPETRTNCLAKWVVALEKSSAKWKTKTFVGEHNHAMANSDFTNVMAPHRKIEEGAREHMHSMHDAGFQTTQIMGFFAHLAGGYRNLSFVKKDLYNYMDSVRKSRIVEGDAAAAISYLKGKTEWDPLAVVKYTYCEERHLGHMFWADGNMQYDYQYFGDVVAFDSTYRKNLYNRPLVIFSGTNHHRQSIIFGFGLVEDEKIASYKWLLQTFLEVMRGKEPKVVVTDGDESMKEAIRSKFPSATHRLCSWHLARNAVANIKDTEFCRAFNNAVYGHFDVDEFEEYWANLVENFGLEENDWVQRTYEKRHHWAYAYLCNKFCAGLRTTSRCEGINSSLKKFIKSGNCLLELVENLDRVVKDYRNNEFIAEYRTLNSEPVLITPLDSLEKGASQVYTREIFFEVRKQIEAVGGLIVLHRESFGSTERYAIRKFRKAHKVHFVLYDRTCEKYECSCKLWNSIGIPCGHIFCVLKEMDIEELPERLVLARWCKNAKATPRSDAFVMSDPEEAFRMRYGALWASALSVCYLGAHGAEAYDEALTALLRATRVLEALVPPGDRGRGEGRNREHCDIADPPIVRSKGAPKGSTNSKNARRCGRCKGVGHDRRNCDYVEDEHADSPEEEGSGAGEVRHQGSQKRQRRTRH